MITLFHIIVKKNMKRVIFLNSFDLMMERYKKELVDANRRSIEQELLNQSEEPEPQAVVVSQLQQTEPVAADMHPQEEQMAEPVTPRQTQPDFTLDEEKPSLEKENKPDADDRSFGTLKVQVFAAQQVYPISSARVLVRPRGEDEIIFEGYTDSSGIVDNIRLPAPGKALSDAPTAIKPYSQYDVFVTQPNFVSRNYLGVPIFPGVESIQTVRLVPRQDGSDSTTVTTESEPNELLMREKGER